MVSSVPELLPGGELLTNHQHLSVVTLVRYKPPLYLSHHAVLGLFVVAVWPTLINIRRIKKCGDISFFTYKMGRAQQVCL